MINRNEKSSLCLIEKDFPKRIRPNDRKNRKLSRVCVYTEVHDIHVLQKFDLQEFTRKCTTVVTGKYYSYLKKIKQSMDNSEGK